MLTEDTLLKVFRLYLLEFEKVTILVMDSGQYVIEFEVKRNRNLVHVS